MSAKFYIISRTGRAWKAFNFIVSISCLWSSYLYCTIMCKRYVEDDYHKSTMKWVIGFESIFLIHCGLNFLVDYTMEGSKTPVRDVAKTSSHYLDNGFKADFIPLIPLEFIPMYRNRQYLFYIIKLSRMAKGMELYNV